MLKTIIKASENFCIHQIREPYEINNGEIKKRTLIAYIDIDTKDTKHLVFEILYSYHLSHNRFEFPVIETPHGYHVLVMLDRMDKDQLRNWFTDIVPEIQKLDDVEYKKQALEPVPGTLYQGDYIVRFKKLEDIIG